MIHTSAHSDSKRSRVQTLRSTRKRRRQILIRSVILCLRTSKSRFFPKTTSLTSSRSKHIQRSIPDIKYLSFCKSLPALQRADLLPATICHVSAFQRCVLTNVIPSLSTIHRVHIPLRWTVDTSMIFFTRCISLIRKFSSLSFQDFLHRVQTRSSPVAFALTRTPTSRQIRASNFLNTNSCVWTWFRLNMMVTNGVEFDNYT